MREAKGEPKFFSLISWTWKFERYMNHDTSSVFFLLFYLVVASIGKNGDLMEKKPQVGSTKREAMKLANAGTCC